jgi:hypothetical protein
MDEIIIHLFCVVADHLSEVKPNLNVNPFPSEVVAIGLLLRSAVVPRPSALLPSACEYHQDDARYAWFI